MEWTHKIYCPVFRKVIFCGGYDQIQKDCTFSLREHDYVLGDFKIGGNAQSISKDRFVHHTSFLWDFCPRRMGYLKIPKKRPDYRGDRDHVEFVTRINEHVKDRDSFVDDIKESLDAKFIVENVDVDIFWGKIEEIVERCVSKGKSRESLSRTSFLNSLEEQMNVRSARF